MFTMRLSRAYFPLLLVLTLLFAQQVGAMHALSHAFANQGQNQPTQQIPEHQSPDKQSSHNPAACGQCAAYTQLGSALNGAIGLLLATAGIAAVARSTLFHLRSTQPLTVVARGPPDLLQVNI